MKLSEFKTLLTQQTEPVFYLPNGEAIPLHAHVTEVGLLTKFFIDCGGTLRNSIRLSIQFWVANDTDHRLHASKILRILEQSASVYAGHDPELLIEYQQNTISLYTLAWEGNRFQFQPTETQCLASDHCGIPEEKMPKPLNSLQPQSACCSPSSSCCS
ncbi:MAG TPA: DUF6428 family protein [Chitinophagaceae bacterium]|nr:DUF6428 family protein [Chitinophagaceae bacterium]HNF71442.1 DUF6428 family protein [Chitinophagaceae bacterium]